MSIRKLVKIIIFLSIFAMAMRVSFDTDTWWHIKTGEYILENLEIPQTDIFSLTRFGESWRGASTGWVMQTSLFLIYSNFGYAGINIFTALMITFAFFILYKTMSGGVFLKGFILIFAVVVSSTFWAARPYLMTFVLSALTILILEDFRWGRKDRLWILPVIMVLWVNSHGGFVYGMILWGLYGIAEGIHWIGRAKAIKNIFSKEWLLNGIKGKVGKLLLIGMLMIIAISINPAGPKMLLYPFETVSITALQDYIQEWQSPNFHSIYAQPFAWMIISLLGIIGISKEKLVLSDFILLGTFTYMGLLAGRNIAHFALISVPIFSRHAAPLTEKLGNKINFHGLSNATPKKLFGVFNLFILLIVSSLVILKMAVVLPSKVNQAHIEEFLPINAINYLKGNPLQGKMLNTYNWGGYQIWELPDYPVFVDARTDLYGDEILHEWISIVRADQGWEEKIEKWEIDIVFIESDMYLARELDTEIWDIVYQDDQAVIFTRNQ